MDGPLVTVETEGRSFQALIKGRSTYVPDGEGKLRADQKDSETGVFISVSPDDFEE